MNRTNTTSLTTIHIPGPASATFDFSSSSPCTIHITVPQSSSFHIPHHWHRQSLGCRSIECLSGGLSVFRYSARSSGGKTGTAPMKASFKANEHIAWKPEWRSSEKNEGQDFVAELVTENGAYGEILYRNICSAILDADRFPNLTSTPLWLRALFAALTWFPQLRSWLVAKMLSVQLEAIYHEHDYRLIHGWVPFTWPWRMQPWAPRAPAWVEMLQWRSVFVLSRIVMTSCYWVGRLFFGMKGEYDEYTPRRIKLMLEHDKNVSGPVHTDYAMREKLMVPL